MQYKGESSDRENLGFGRRLTCFILLEGCKIFMYMKLDEKLDADLDVKLDRTGAILG